LLNRKLGVLGQSALELRPIVSRVLLLSTAKLGGALGLAGMLCLAAVGHPHRAYADGSDGTWQRVESMNNSHCLGATLLINNDKVLVTSGFNGTGLTNTSELYDPQSKTWKFTGNINRARQSWRSNLVNLPNGRALLVGGADQNVTSLASAELYDPGVGTWSYAASMNVPRRQPAVVALKSGKVLVAAGANGPPDGNRFLASAELYDPATNQWTFTGSMHVAREIGGAVLLHDGRALVAGGEGPWNTPGNTAEIYDPTTGQWTLTAPMPYGWFGGASMLVLPNGKVLAAGGSNSSIISTAIIYDPAQGTWSYTGSMSEARSQGSIALLGNGKVLVAGGNGANGKDLQTSELYDPTTGQWSQGPIMLVTHNAPNELSRLANGDMLMVGACPAVTHNTAEVLVGQFPPTPGWYISSSGAADTASQCRVIFVPPNWCYDIQNGRSSIIYENSSGLRILWGTSYVYQHPGESNLYWYAQVWYINVGQSTVPLSCDGRTDPSIVKELMRGTADSGYVLAQATYCSYQPTYIGSIQPGAAHMEWAIFHNVPPGGEISLEWGPYGSSQWVNPWYRPYPDNAPEPQECPPELVTLGYCAGIPVK
jgi:WD40 repeat protein